MKNRCILVICFAFAQFTYCYSQSSIYELGLRFQKTFGLYYENGVTMQYSSQKLKPDQLYFGFSYVTSRLGTAFNSNAIKQDNVLLSTGWYFRKEHVFRPIATLNLGLFHADYEEVFFDVLPNNSLLLSPEIGVMVDTRYPVKARVTLGYNVITGNGESGAGTLYPLFVQSSFTWTVPQH